jgi:hypothetical protein
MMIQKNTYYEVQKGDTLYSISKVQHISCRFKQNNISEKCHFNRTKINNKLEALFLLFEVNEKKAPE